VESADPLNGLIERSWGSAPSPPGFLIQQSCGGRVAARRVLLSAAPPLRCRGMSPRQSPHCWPNRAGGKHSSDQGKLQLCPSRSCPQCAKLSLGEEEAGRSFGFLPEANELLGFVILPVQRRSQALLENQQEMEEVRGCRPFGSSNRALNESKGVVLLLPLLTKVKGETNEQIRSQLFENALIQVSGRGYIYRQHKFCGLMLCGARSFRRCGLL
jgi:hypothetical protein